MLKLLSKPQPKHHSFISKINNKPHKLDYETIKNIVQDNTHTSIGTLPQHKSNKPRRSLK